MCKPRVLVGIQARLGSTRFPRKIEALIHGKPMLQHVYDRACEIPGVDVVWALMLVGETVCGYRGAAWWGTQPEGDVLARYHAAAADAEADVIMRLTGDCPALNPAVCAIVLWTLLADSSLRYVSNSWHQEHGGYPSGLDCEVFTREALNEAARLASTPDDREHVTPWMQRHAGLAGAHIWATSPWNGPAKLSVDTPEDLAVVTEWLDATP